MKTKNKKSVKSSKSTFVRYGAEQRKAICAFMKTHNNEQTKAKFGCSAHWAGALRREMKIPLVMNWVNAPKKPEAKISAKKKSLL